MAIVIPYVKQPWTDGSGGGTPISAARLGVLEEGILDVSDAPAVRVFHNANQSITASTLTILAFNSERFDQAGGSASTMHDTVTNNSRLTAIYAGIYNISANVDWAAGTATQRTVILRLNATTNIARTDAAAAASITFSQQVSCHYALSVNDFVEVQVFQATAGALNVSASANYSPEFSMVRVG